MSPHRRRIAGVLSTALVAAATTVLVGASAAPASAAPCMVDEGGECLQTFRASDKTQEFVVPEGVTTMTAQVLGAAGRSHTSCCRPALRAEQAASSDGFGSVGGLGGLVVGEFPVVPGSTLHVLVGGVDSGSGGGGGSYLFGPASGPKPVVIVAGGGGEAADDGQSTGADGGDGGGVTSVAPATGGSNMNGGGPGSETTGGMSGSGFSDGQGPAMLREDGTVVPGAGGSAVQEDFALDGGNGGDGWYGGAAGGSGKQPGGGGGGSGHVSDAVTLTTTAAGYKGGDGRVVLTWTPAPQGPVVTTTTLPDAVFGTAYSQTLTATGTPPYAWKVVGGALPAGLMLSEDGVISGTPTAATVDGKPAAFTVRVEDASGTASTPKDLTLAVAKAPQTVTFSTQAEAPVVGGTYRPLAGGGATGGKVGYQIASASAAVCSLVTSEGRPTVTFTSVGTCTIQATQAGNSDYNDGSAQQDVVVSKAAQMITFTSTPPDPARINGSYVPTATGGKSGQRVEFTVEETANDLCAVSTGTDLDTMQPVPVVTFRHAGTCVVTANQAGNDGYSAAPQVTESITVAKDAQSVSITSAAPTDATVGGAAYAVRATGSENNNAVSVVLDESTINGACTVTGTTVSFVHAGTCALVAKQAGGPDDTAAVSAVQSFAVRDVDVPVVTPTPTPTPIPTPSPAPTVARPTITAAITSSRPITSYGWYSAPVTVTFTCTAAAASPLTTACPGPVTINRNSSNRTVTGTAKAANGATATVTAGPVNIDTTAPEVRVKQRAGKAPRCRATDARSGVARCTIKRKLTGRGTVLIAKAFDEAGNRAVRRIRLGG